ncbi:MAG: S41 family peptidase [Chloroflexota bacterium]
MMYRLKRVCTGLLLLGCGFVMGVLVTQHNWLGFVTPAQAASNPIELTIFDEAWNLIEARFVDREQLDSSRLSYAAINAIITELGDTGHTRFLPPNQAEQHNTSMDGRFFGIGARLGVNEAGDPIIVKPFIGSPAEKSGILAGDRLIRVDGREVVGLTVGEIVERIRGEEGTVVTLTVQHPAQNELDTVQVVRGEIVIPAVSWTMIPESSIGLIRLDQFSAQATNELKRALAELKDLGMEGIVMDVRGNPGGLLSQAIDVTSEFLTDGNVLLERDGIGNRREFPVKEGGSALDLPLVILIDRGSASSSEIFAGAVQDQARGKLVGETTFGTGTVLTPYTLSDGSLLLLGTSEWLTGGGRSIRNQGIQPDVSVIRQPDDIFLVPDEIGQLDAQTFYSSTDRQLLRAINILLGCDQVYQCQQLDKIR